MRRFIAFLCLSVFLAAPAVQAGEPGARPEVIDILTAQLAIAESAEEAAEIAEALRAVYGESESASAEVLFSQSRVVVTDNDGQAALYKLTRALVLDEDMVAALVLRGDVRLEDGNVVEAFEDAVSAVELAPDYYASLGLLARTFEAQGYYVSALATTREALLYYPLSEELRDQLARHRALASGLGY